MSRPGPDVAPRILTGGRVVVGLDGSPDAAAALTAGLEEGARRGLPVTAVLAFPAPDAWAADWDVAILPEPGPLETAMVETARGFAADATADLPARLRRVPLEVRVHAGSPAPVLARAGRDAVLVVVGHRGRGALGSRVLGSTGLRLLALAPCPVLVVRAPAAGPGVGDGTTAGPLVVGVDGSPDSALALRWALDDAVRRGLRVTVATGLAPPVVEIGFRSLPVPTPEEVRAAVAPRVEEFVREVLAEHARAAPVPEVDVVLRPEGPAWALTGLAAEVGADRIVVGHRGRHAPARAVLGSVAYGVVVHAPCSVVVVGGGSDAGAHEPSDTVAAAQRA